VIVLSQVSPVYFVRFRSLLLGLLTVMKLDDRYFCGLEGQYRFWLAFRVHKAGEEDYIVRSQSPYGMQR
jgi:hypothetical protein